MSQLFGLNMWDAGIELERIERAHADGETPKTFLFASARNMGLGCVLNGNSASRGAAVIRRLRRLRRLKRPRVDLIFEIFERGKASALLGTVRRTECESVERLAIQRKKFACAAACQFKSGDEFHRFLRLLEAPTTGAFLAPGRKTITGE